MVTDGVSETHNPQGEMFGRARLIALLKECQHLTIEQTTLHLQESLSHFRSSNPQQDDVTVLLLEMTDD